MTSKLSARQRELLTKMAAGKTLARFGTTFVVEGITHVSPITVAAALRDGHITRYLDDAWDNMLYVLTDAGRAAVAANREQEENG